MTSEFLAVLLLVTTAGASPNEPPSSPRTSDEEIVLCLEPVPNSVAQANASFYLYFRINLDEEGKAVSVEELLPSEADMGSSPRMKEVRSRLAKCLEGWVVPVDEDSVVVSYLWEHAKGWTEFRVMSGSFVTRYRISPPLHLIKERETEP